MPSRAQTVKPQEPHAEVPKNRTTQPHLPQKSEQTPSIICHLGTSPAVAGRCQFATPNRPEIFRRRRRAPAWHQAAPPRTLHVCRFHRRGATCVRGARSKLRSLLARNVFFSFHSKKLPYSLSLALCISNTRARFCVNEYCPSIFRLG